MRIDDESFWLVAERTGELRGQPSIVRCTARSADRATLRKKGRNAPKARLEFRPVEGRLRLAGKHKATQCSLLHSAVAEQGLIATRKSIHTKHNSAPNKRERTANAAAVFSKICCEKTPNNHPCPLRASTVSPRTLKSFVRQPFFLGSSKLSRSDVRISHNLSLINSTLPQIPANVHIRLNAGKKVCV